MVKRALIHQLVDAERRLPDRAPKEEHGQGAVVWIAGLPGSGKSRVAALLKDRFTTRGVSAVLLEDETMQDLFGGNATRSTPARLDFTRNHGRLAQMLAHQGKAVICTSTALRLQVYDWNRKNLPHYVEVFLDVPANACDGHTVQPRHHQIVDIPPSADVHITSDQTPATVDMCDQIDAVICNRLFVQGEIA